MYYNKNGFSRFFKYPPCILFYTGLYITKLITYNMAREEKTFGINRAELELTKPLAEEIHELARKELKRWNGPPYPSEGYFNTLVIRQGKVDSRMKVERKSDYNISRKKIKVSSALKKEIEKRGGERHGKFSFPGDRTKRAFIYLRSKALREDDFQPDPNISFTLPFPIPIKSR